MKNILIIDHQIKGKASYFIPDLLELITQKGIIPRCSNEIYGGFDARAYAAVISASGSCTIRGNEELGSENRFTDICEKVGTPTLYMGHGAQIKAVHMAGDDAIVEAKSPRKSIHSDYVAVEGAEDDPILTGIDIGKLTSKEYHGYAIVNVGDQHQNLLVDPEGNTILAGHKDQNVISYLMQMHPELKPELHPQVNYGFTGRLNSVQLLINFLNMVELRD